MTKPDVLATGVGGEDVADLDLVAGHDDSIDQQFDELPPLFKGRVSETGRDPVAERLHGGRESQHLVEAGGLPAELGLLRGQGRTPSLDLGAAALVFREWDDAADVGLGEALE